MKSTPGDFQFPAAALSQHIAIVGKTGSGKTSTAKLAVEQVVEQGARVCVLDPIKSDWWGITSNADGKRPGLPFHILGGPHGHVPLHSSAGKAVGEVVATGALRLSIIDMANFEAGGHSRFFVDFAQTLLRRTRGVMYLVIEEAHFFAPKERSGLGNENMAIHYAKLIATAGRSKGIRMMVLTQRTQALHNALLGSCDTLIAQRFTAPADQEPIVKWLKANVDKTVREQVERSLSSLPTGQGWICAGEAGVFERVSFPRIKTYDNTATPTGDMADRQVAMASIDVEHLRTIVGEAVSQAEAEDPRALKAQIAKLQKQVDAKQTTASGPSEAEIQRRISEAVASAAQPVAPAPISKALIAGVEKIAAGLQQIQGELAGVPAEIVPRARTIVRERAAAAPAVQQSHPGPVAAGVTSAEQRVLDAIAWWNAANVPAPTRHQVAFVAGYTVNGHFNNICGTLRTRGLIDYPAGSCLGLLPAGTEKANAPDVRPSKADLVNRVMAVLKGEPMRRLFQTLVDADQPLARDDLARRSGYTVNGHFNNLCGALNGIGIAEYPSKGLVGLTSIFGGLHG